jgi:Na+/H+-dicarboxylate symporter
MTSTVRNFVGFVLGLAAGSALGVWNPTALPDLLGVAKVVGHLWFNALQMAVVPLVFAMVVGGIVKSGETGRASLRDSAKVIGVGAACLVAAALFGAFVAETMLEIWPPPSEWSKPFADVLGRASPEPFLKFDSAWIANLLPLNPIRAAADGAIAPWLAFSILFGAAALRQAPGPRAALAQVIDAILGVLLTIMGWVLALSPIGLAALGILLGQQAGPMAASPLAHYVVIGSIVNMALFLAVFAVAGLSLGRRLPDFMRAAAPAQFVALSTQSSVASLPAMVSAARALNVPESSGRVILTLVVTLFRVGSAASMVCVALYVARLAGVHPTYPAIILACLLSALISVVAVGLPSQVSFVALLSPICVLLNAPVEFLVVVMTVDLIPDAIRTAVTVTADIAFAAWAGSAEEVGSEGLGQPPVADSVSL